MRIHAMSAEQCWRNALEKVLRFGDKVESRNGMSKELTGVQMLIERPELRWNSSRRRALSPAYAAAELFWYLSREETIERLLSYAPQYAGFATDNGVATGAYGKRIAHNQEDGDQLALLCGLLKQDPSSRQAVISLWRANDLRHAWLRDWKDLPCTLSMQFLVRAGRLEMITTMRSNDLWLGTPYDLFCFESIQALLACHLRYEIGVHVHNVGSLHIYDKNAVAAEEVSGDPITDTVMRLIQEAPGTDEQISEQLHQGSSYWTRMESRLRLLAGNPGMTEQFDRTLVGIREERTGWMDDLLLCCGRKLSKSASGKLTGIALPGNLALAEATVVKL